MPLRYEDRILVASSTTGTGTFTLGSAITGHRNFSSLTDLDTVFYRAAEVDSDGIETGAFEIGYGTYTASGTTLSRDRVIASSNSTTAIPVIESVGAVTETDSGTTTVTNAPSGVAVGDLLLLFVGDSTSLTPGGLTKWAKISEASSTSRLHLYARIADGSADDTPTLTHSAADITTCILRISGASMPHNIVGINQPSSTVTPPLATVVSTINNCLILAGLTQATRTWDASPSGWTVKLEAETANMNKLGIWSKSGTTAGSFGGETVTLSGAGAATPGITVALAPVVPKVSFANALRISVIANAAKLGRPDIQTFTSSGVWTKPLWATETEVICIGGGGGGGTGNALSGATNADRGGGGSGSGGVITNVLLKTSSLNSLETVTVGAAGAGGANTGSNAGTAGGATSFGSFAYAAGGAAGGAGGTGSGGTAGAAQGVTGLFQEVSVAGAIGGSDSAGITPTSFAGVRCTGGGSGASYNGSGAGSPQTFAGGSGGTLSSSGVTVNSVAGGSAGTAGGTTGVDGGGGNTLEFSYGIPIGTGGGGGGSGVNAAGNAAGGAGGAGGGYGGGGGGGGAAAASGTATRGGGGNGAPGICIIVSY